MTPLVFAMIITGVVFTGATLALWLGLRWYTRRVAELNRLAYVYGIERQPGESNRQLNGRIRDRVSLRFPQPGRRAHTPRSWRNIK